MNIEVDTVKGFKDYLPPESLKKEAVKKIIENSFQRFGFVPIETPIIEFDELMRSDALQDEDEAISDRFRLKDRAGRNLGLRYEFTFQLARIFKQNPNIKLPFRRYQIGALFRDEPIGPGRFRQFMQCDADIIGDDSPSADAECLMLIADILARLEIKNVEIQVNNRQLITALIESVEIKEIEKVMKEIDKIDKIGEDAVKANLKKYADPNQIITLFKLLEKDMEFFLKNAFDGAKEIAALKETCSLQGVTITFNPRLIRGLSYYTGNIFEVREPGKNSIAAGGRYNKLVGKLSNREIPAVGISFGLERMTQVANIVPQTIPQVILISLKQEEATQKLAKILRDADIACVISYDKVGKALEYANAYAIPYVVIIGEDEIAKKKYKRKNMRTGEESYVTDKQLIKSLLKITN